MFVTVDNVTLAAVTGGLRGNSPHLMLMMVGLMMSRMGGDKDRKMKMFDLFKGMLEKQLPGAGGKKEEKKDEKKDDKK